MYDHILLFTYTKIEMNFALERRRTEILPHQRNTRAARQGNHRRKEIDIGYQIYVSFPYPKRFQSITIRRGGGGEAKNDDTLPFYVSRFGGNE